MRPLTAEERLETRKLLAELLDQRLAVQRSAAERVEAKAAIVLGVATGVLQLVLGQKLTSEWLGPAVAAYFVAIVMSVVCLALRRNREVDPGALLRELWNAPAVFTYSQLANNRLDAFTVNMGRVRWRIRAWWCAVAALVAATVLSVLHVRYGVPIQGAQP